MENKIKIIIADDNKGFCDLLLKYFKKYDDVEVLAIAYTDEEEIKQIEELKPEIVVTDLVRNHKYTGLDIIKEYCQKKEHPKFLVISADREEDVISDEVNFASYIKKPCYDYDIIIQEIRKIKKEIISERNQMILKKEEKLKKFNIIDKFFDLFKIKK